jgi:tetratricopeptide (TPR) repeat protein
MKVAGLKRVSCIVIAATALFGLPPAILGATQLPVAVQDDSADSHPRFDLSRLELNSARRVEVEAALAKKDYKQAETILVEEVERDPQSFRAANLLEFAGGIFFLDGEYLNSVIAWKRAEAITPLGERTRFTLAMAYIRLNRRNWARPELEKLTAAQPGNSLYPYWLARLDYDGQKYLDAIRRLKKVIALDPRMTRAYDLLGLCYDYLGRLDEAVASFSHAVGLNRMQSSPSPWPNLDMAISQMELNQLAEAEKNVREAINYDSRLPQSRYQLGRVLEQQGRNQEAVLALKEAAALDPAYPEPHYLLGRIYQRLGQPELAKTEIERFQQLQKPRSTSPALGASPPLN